MAAAPAPEPRHLPLGMFGIGLHVGDTGALAVGFFTPQAGILAGAIQFIPNPLKFGMVGTLPIHILADALQLSFQSCSVGVFLG